MRPSHALRRAIERCPGVCPGMLIRGLSHGILQEDENLCRFVATCARTCTTGLYYFQLPDGRARYALAAVPTGHVITILLPGYWFQTSRGKKWLGEQGLEALPKDFDERKNDEQ